MIDIAGLPFLVLLMLMGGRKPAAPPAPPLWPGQRPVQPRPKPNLPGFIPPDQLTTQPVQPRPKPNLPGFIPPDLVFSSMPVTVRRPAAPAPARPTPRPRNVVELPIRSPGQPTAPPPPRSGLPMPKDLEDLLPNLPDLVPPPDMSRGVPIPPPPPEAPPPEVVIAPIPADDESPTESEPRRKIVIVKPGEGLSQVAKRLGRPGTITDVRALRAANIPEGPDAEWHTTESGNLAKEGRKGGLQPGDKLFVPEGWVE